MEKKRGEGIEYRRKKQEYKEVCERKRRGKRERKAAEAKGEKEIWEIINSERRKSNRINEGIEMKEW